MAAHTRRGFTIVELLVVITIIGILMALLFPAINAAREAARRGNCVNNEGQVGKAVLTSTTLKGNFPKHLKNDPTNAQPWPWVIRVLAPLGRGDIYDVMTTASPAQPDPATRTERIDILICPSDPPVDPTSLQINYVANTGIDGLDDVAGNGIFNQTKDVSLSYVAQNDGTATTLMLSENIDATTWNAKSTALADVFQTALIWQATEPAGFGLNKGVGGAASKNLARPSSKHSGGFVVTFCDGHTEFISQEIGYTIYSLIMTPAGQKLTPAQAPLKEQDLDK